MRPIMFLLDAYLSKHYRNLIGSMRKVMCKIWGDEFFFFNSIHFKSA